MSWIMLEYQCALGHVTEDIERPSIVQDNSHASTIPCGSDGCQMSASLAVPLTLPDSAPMTGTSWGGSVSRGKSDERPHGVLDTRALAEGMPLKEWKQKRKEFWRDKDRAEIKMKAG